MTEQPLMTPPERPQEQWEEKVQHLVRDFRYPPTPDIAAGVRRRSRRSARRVWRAVAVATVLMVLVILLVPPVRAFVLEVIRVGVVRIFLVEPTATSTPTLETTDPQLRVPTATPEVIFELDGRMSLAEAQKQVGTPILLPGYPSDLGEPDLVFVHHYNEPVITLVWLQPGSDDEVRLVLEILNPRVVASKLYPYEGERQSTQVNGHPAEWLTEAHEVFYFGGSKEVRRPVTGHVLVWEMGGLTYRLETDLPLEEALKIAESLQTNDVVGE